METPRIPLLDLSFQHAEILGEVEREWRAILLSNRFILGPHVAAFEEEVARYLGARHAVAVASGTDALLLALRALDVGPGDEVVLPAFTFVSTAEGVVHLGAVPVYADIDPRTFTLIPSLPIGPKTKAIIPVHLFGHPADLEPLLHLKIPLVEDGAQSFGATLHGRPTLSIGTLGATSFYPSKNLGGMGDGGMIVTNRADFAQRLRRLRNHGWDARKYEPTDLGTNSRLDELQAAVLRIKLRRLNRWNDLRRTAAQRYDALLKDLVQTPLESPGVKHVYHLYCIRSPRRDAIAGALAEAGIESGVYYPVPIPRTPAFRAEGSYPNAELVSREILALPLFPGISGPQQERVAEVIRCVIQR